jgi:hypothetical protein
MQLLSFLEFQNLSPWLWNLCMNLQLCDFLREKAFSAVVISRFRSGLDRPKTPQKSGFQPKTDIIPFKASRTLRIVILSKAEDLLSRTAA